MRYVMVLFFSIVLWSAGSAAPIIFTHSAVGSGSIDGVPFSSRPFTIRGQGDTSNIVSGDSVILDLDYAQIEIGELGVFIFTEPTREFLSPSGGVPPFMGLPVVGFARVDFGGFDLVDGPTSTSLEDWDMRSSIGPLIGLGSIVQWDDFPIKTSGGRLTLNTADVDITYTATVVPEPCGVALTTLSIIWLLSSCRSHRR